MYDTHVNNIILSAKHWGSDNEVLLPKIMVKQLK